ncbi:MAG TPA: cytochrome c oxidase assembly protein [Acidimicrobiales bacterium]|jgi:cytochrome c oxidase assembly factor CtaG|nr:cytochrome c oxidase assembly protein [Acidimicrobiales bacterium]
MRYLTQHWSFDPFVIVVVITVAANELGLHRLRQHSIASRTRRRRRNALIFYAGLASLLIAICSPVDYWSSSYFFVHMIEHVIIVFLAPVLVVAGAPWIPLMFALPVKTRRKVGRFLYLDKRARALRAFGRFVRSPWVALISFNAAMLVWHVPALFDLSERNQLVHVWAMHTSFFVTGVLFWLQIVESYPMKPLRGPLWQGGSILITNVIMTVLAISMSMLTTSSWYSAYAHVPGVTLSPFADQQIGAAILWVCGDFWAYPALIFVIRRAIAQEGSLSNVIERLTGRAGTMTPESFHRQHVAPATTTPTDVPSEN